MEAQALTLAYNLQNNLQRNQNPPSSLDLSRGGGGGIGGILQIGNLPSVTRNNHRGQGEIDVFRRKPMCR